VRNCWPPVATNGHPRPLAPVAANRFVDRATGRHNARAQRNVVPLDLTLGNRRHERRMHFRSTRNHQQPARILIEPVNDPRSRYDGQLWVECQQRVLQRLTGVPRTRMHDHPRRLVDYQQRAIFEDDVQRQRFRHHLLVRLDASLDHDPLAAKHLVPPAQQTPVDLDGSGLDPTLEPGPGVLREHPRKGLIEP
jgi:hypothetical protein